MKPFKPLRQTQINPTRWLLPAILILAVYSAVVGTIWLVRGNSGKMAYVNSAEVLKRYKGAVEANKRFEEEAGKWEANIKTLQSELDSLNFLIVKESQSWNLSKKREVAEFAKKKESDFRRYSEAIQQKAASRQQELLTPVLADINNKIADYAKSEGYVMVFGTTDGNIVYADQAVDITENVLQVLNR